MIPFIRKHHSKASTLFPTADGAFAIWLVLVAGHNPVTKIFERPDWSKKCIDLKSAALETAKSGIRINAVCPAVVETAMGERLFGAPQVKKYVLGSHPIGRFGRPTEIAEAELWMCSNRASVMTGQSLVLDGGFLAGPNSPS